MKTKNLSRSKRFIQGFTLLECLVAMALGTVVIGAALAIYFGTIASGRSIDAWTQVAEDTQVALRLLRSQISMADFSLPATSGGAVEAASAPIAYVLDADANGTLPSIWGCDGGFVNPRTPLTVEAPSLACKGGAGPDAVLVRYQADTRTTFAAASGAPTDCLGRALLAVPAQASAPEHYVADNRFYVNEDGNLACVGNGGAAPGALFDAGQPLVSHTVDLQFKYGVGALLETGAAASAPRQTSSQVVAYLNATEVTAQHAWPRVIAVQICWVNASALRLSDAPTPYLNCEDQSVLPTEQRAYRSFKATVALESRLGISAPSAPSAASQADPS
jgi:type IV pilus assembly protein PilW